MNGKIDEEITIYLTYNCATFRTDISPILCLEVQDTSRNQKFSKKLIMKPPKQLGKTVSYVVAFAFLFMSLLRKANKSYFLFAALPFAAFQLDLQCSMSGQDLFHLPLRSTKGTYQYFNRIEYVLSKSKWCLLALLALFSFERYSTEVKYQRTQSVCLVYSKTNQFNRKKRNTTTKTWFASLQYQLHETYSNYS